MFKSKDTRDTILLIFMALIIITFLVYVFIPRGNKDVKPLPVIHKETPPVPIKIQKKQDPVETMELPEETVPSEENILQEYNQCLETELIKISTEIYNSHNPFELSRIDSLKNVLLQPGNNLVEKLNKYSFFDLDDISKVKFPASYSNALKFNLFVSLFLIKIQEELVEKAFESLHKVELQKLVNFDVYGLINNEIEKEYQSLPLLFYFKHLLKQVNVYLGEDKTRFFKDGCKELRDLTPSKYLVKMLDLLNFSRQKENFSIQWREEDGVFGDDKKTYKSVLLNVNHFLMQEYILFPDTNSDNNLWIKELCKSDPGEIELKYFDLQNEDPARHLNIKKIIYTPINCRFVTLLEEYPVPEKLDVLERLVIKRLTDYHESYIIIDFLQKDTEQKNWIQALKKFGKHLKKNITEVN